MSGLIALLDDVAAIAKVASASIDDVVGQAVKASTKTAGAVIDDAAVTPKYVHGFKPERELPIVWKITKGSLFNKLVLLLPAALLLSIFAPWLVYPLLMIGGCYLAYEGTEKVWHVISPKHHDQADAIKEKVAGKTMEDDKVKGAIQTDFILSAEIMTIVLSAVPTEESLVMKAAVLAVAALLITVVVYGAVALIVKADDVGLALANNGRLGATRAVGRFIVRAMPILMDILIVVGTAAMIWVGGSILVHSLHELGVHGPYDFIHNIAVSVSQTIVQFQGALEWFVTAFLDGLVGLAVGAVLIPLVGFVMGLLGKKAH